MDSRNKRGAEAKGTSLEVGSVGFGSLRRYAENVYREWLGCQALVPLQA